MPPDSIQFDYAAQGPVLAAYIADNSRRALITGPLGSGKTNASCYRINRHVREQEPVGGVRSSRWVAVRNTYSDLLSTTAKDWLDMWGELGPFRESTREPPHHELAFRLPDGTRVEAELLFIALDRIDHVKKVRGLQATGAYLSEAKELPKSVVDMLDLRVGRYPNGAKGVPTYWGMIGDTNQCDEDHWLYEFQEHSRPEGWSFFRQPGGVVKLPGSTIWTPNDRAENIANLPPSYYADGMSGKSLDWIAVNLGNEYGFATDGKPVYPEYSDQFHCRPFEVARDAGLRIGLDFGLTPAATISVRDAVGRWRTRSEVVCEDMGAVKLAEELLRHLGSRYVSNPVEDITGDPAGEAEAQTDQETVYRVLAANGVMARPAHTNDFTIRRESVAKLLTKIVDGEPAWLIHPDCKVLRKGMAGAYCFRRLQVAGSERFKDKPDKTRESHVCEAFQYSALGGGEGRLLVRPERRAPRSSHARSDYSMYG